MTKPKVSVRDRQGDACVLLTLQQTAELLKRKRSTVRRLIRQKKLCAVLVGPEIMVTASSLQDYLRPRPYEAQRGAPVCAGWNDKLRAELAGQKGTEVQP